MKERPILFNAPMVRAILAGQKTQTRRVVKVQPPADLNDGRWYADRYNNGPQWCWWGKRGTDVEHRCAHHIGQVCPYGVVGDRLWVRETWNTTNTADTMAPRNLQSAAFDGGVPLRYQADGAVHGLTPGQWGKTRPSIHMPRWASRLTLTITDVRVQRLQDISEADAVAEGLDGRDLFACTWVNLYGPKSWLTNPWVWAITFERGAQ